MPFVRGRLLAAAVVLAAGALAAPACGSTEEGERCLPEAYADECGDGLTCGVPENCVAAVCCPTDGSSTDPACAACPPLDGAGGAGAGGSDGGGASEGGTAGNGGQGGA